MKKIEINTLNEYSFLSAIEFSTNANYTAFIKTNMILEKNEYFGSIYLLDNQTNEIKQLTTVSTVSSFTWLDDENIIFNAKRDKQTIEKLANYEEITDYYKINIHGGEAIKYFSLPLLSSKLTVLDSNLFLLSASHDNSRPDLEGLNDLEKTDILKKYHTKDYTIYDEIPFVSNGNGVVNKKRKRLYIYNSLTNSLEAITDKLFNTIQYKHDGDYVVYTGSLYKDVAAIKAGMYMYNLETKKTTTLIEPNTFSIRNYEIYNNQVLMILSDNLEYGLNQNGDLYSLDLNSKNLELFLEHNDYTIGSNSTNSDVRYGTGLLSKIDNDKLYYVTTEINNAHLAVIDLITRERKHISKLNSIDCFDVLNDKVIAVGQEIDSLTEIYQIFKEQEIRISDFNSFVKNEYLISLPESLTSTSCDNTKIHGFIIKPTNYQEGRSYPAILNIHGGPRTVFSDIFHHEMQVWANEGYFVIYANPRGSDGRGNEFGDITSRYGTIDYTDLMEFLDFAIQNYPGIDPNRLGVTGGSYGGFMTNWIIGHTDRFKAACSQRCIANWTSFEGTTDIGHYFAKDQVGASHMENFELQWQQSPLKYAKNVKTPTLFIHSDEDYRCYYVEAMQMFSALKLQGVESRMCLFKGDNHDLSRSGKPQNRIKRMEEILNWMNSYLK